MVVHYPRTVHTYSYAEHEISDKMYHHKIKWEKNVEQPRLFVDPKLKVLWQLGWMG